MIQSRSLMPDHGERMGESLHLKLLNRGAGEELRFSIVSSVILEPLNVNQ